MSIPLDANELALTTSKPGKSIVINGLRATAGVGTDLDLESLAVEADLRGGVSSEGKTGRQLKAGFRGRWRPANVAANKDEINT